jgi:hypothetical protein
MDKEESNTHLGTPKADQDRHRSRHNFAGELFDLTQRHLWLCPAFWVCCKVVRRLLFRFFSSDGGNVSLARANKAALQNPTFRGVLGIVAFVFVVLVAFLFELTENQKTNRIQIELERSAASMAVKTSEALKFSIDNLHSAARFITHVPEIKFQQFQNITASFFDLDPGLLILEW